MLDGVQSCVEPVCAEAGAVLTAEHNCCALHAACLVATYLAKASSRPLSLTPPELLYNEHLRHDEHFGAITPESNIAEDEADLCIMA